MTPGTPDCPLLLGWDSKSGPLIRCISNPARAGDAVPARPSDGPLSSQGGGGRGSSAVVPYLCKGAVSLKRRAGQRREDDGNRRSKSCRRNLPRVPGYQCADSASRPAAQRGLRSSPIFARGMSPCPCLTPFPCVHAIRLDADGLLQGNSFAACHPSA